MQSVYYIKNSPPHRGTSHLTLQAPSEPDPDEMIHDCSLRVSNLDGEERG